MDEKHKNIIRISIKWLNIWMPIKKRLFFFYFWHYFVLKLIFFFYHLHLNLLLLAHLFKLKIIVLHILHLQFVNLLFLNWFFWQYSWFFFNNISQIIAIVFFLTRNHLFFNHWVTTYGRDWLFKSYLFILRLYCSFLRWSIVTITLIYSFK